jgi:hypothetical protein
MRHDTPHYSLIAASLSGNPRAPGPEWNWDETVATAAREAVLPTLHGKLPCPLEISEFLEAIHELNAQRNGRLLGELETLASLLNQAGIEPVLLKGAAYLVTGVYANPADRFLLDIDLLAGNPQSAQAFEIIRRAGYEPHIPKLTALGRHHYPVLIKNRCVPIEIHNSLGFGVCGTFLSANEVIRDSRPIQLGRATVRIPSPEHLMTHLVMHSQMHHGAYDRVWPSLRAMLDLVLLGRRFAVPWDVVRSRFRRYGKATLLNLHLMQVEKAMGIPPPFAVSSGGIRWWYRKALWREPKLRYLDPSYIFSRVLVDKFHVARHLLKDPAGRRFVLSTPFRRSFYKRLLADIGDG